MLRRIITILECSRVYALPMTIMAWLIVFTFSVVIGGNVLYGLMALLGIGLVHLATNVMDDYFDYKALIKQVNFDKEEYLNNSQKTKCRFIVSGVVKHRDLLLLAFLYLTMASFLGLFFILKCGIGVLYFAIVGGFVAISYSFLSKMRLSELVVALTYGPALFGGVYYVMLKSFSWTPIILSIPSMFVTLVLLYNHTVMDYGYDIKEGHKTIANSFSTQQKALKVLKVILLLAYTSPILLCIFDILDWQVFLTCLTIPLAVDLYKSMELFLQNSESMPKHKWYHFPMEDMRGAPSFMYRMFQSRNLVIYYSLLYSVAVLLALV